MNPDSLRERLASEGWKTRERPGFMGTAGPLWTRREGDGWAYGCLPEARHLNAAGVVHGGLVFLRGRLVVLGEQVATGQAIMKAVTAR